MGCAWRLGKINTAAPQTLLVRARFGARYRRKRWDSILLGAVIAGDGYAFARTLLSLLFIALT